MDKFGKSQPVRRLEDRRFITGQGRYIDDVAPKDAWHAVFVRSQVAHGKLSPVDLSEVRDMPGVKAAYAAADLTEMGIDYTMPTEPVRNLDGSKGALPPRPILARDKVLFVGDAIAVIVAETKREAQDAAEAVMADIDELPAKVDMAEGGETLHPEAPSNLAFDWGKGDMERVEGIIAKAPKVVKTRIFDNRIIVNSMEPRGVYAEWDGTKLHVGYSGQGVWGLKAELAGCFGLDAENVRVTTPDVGGGFGMKGMDYPEYFVIAAAAKALNHPVRWIAERTESMLTDNGGRDLLSDTTLAFDDDNRILAYKVETLCNLGAHNSGYAQQIQTELFAKVAMGTYDVRDIALHSKGFFTNTTQIDAYRGAGRPEAIFALERSMDNAARELGVDPWELRRINFIPPSKFPYKTAIADTYDVGDFARVMDRAKIECDADGFPARRKESEAKGKLRGFGLCYYIESILGDPSEHARVVFEEDGTVSLFVGTQSNGQGHETVYAAFLSDQTGIPVEKIRVVQGDTDLIPSGGGTGGSRSVTTQSAATLKTVDTVTKQFAEYLAGKNDGAEVTFDDERFRIAGSNATPSMIEVAAMAREDGRTDILDVREKNTLPQMSFPNGAHIAEVEIDPDTGLVKLVKYSVTDDFGNLINPMLAEGQVHGGVAQGVGQALTEHVVYDETGQLLTATFMDYGMPRADDMPMIHFVTEAVPSTANPMGMKGCGEAGTVAALAAVSNAVADALATRGVPHIDMPFTAAKVWHALNGSSMAAE
ncbi:xanthine dehydrogenase family protein molybdopterin-binding subunit [Silicimonas algicola]|uniref:Carbon-monoxide dehydrogenase large subunit n=1 Tax=Silicimonas algicola TaxID=1826607 RepID=A0A316G9R6_9RHOB|nr:xanthine dehydrogenase family protein molybdopterin-binding subunit [Silicimonas algicola]AZQ67276.1 xanthine dehydrogenase family protein molybdopterin-binding subunit [Silicimonas algicola]PWK56945.1 carbon-monoxide dehydrogenase large subunit [Silicimonas algicola]